MIQQEIAWQQIAQQISRVTEIPFTIMESTGVNGGCINDAWRLTGADGRHFFVKTNSSCNEDMFAAEAAGLREIIASGTVIAPAPICLGVMGNTAFLVLEYFSFGTGDASQNLGHRLARMHRHTRASYGWSRDNTIGSTPQINTLCRDWSEFWCKQRLGYQLQRAEQNGYGGNLQQKGEQLLQLIPVLFSSYTPAASLLHGDLWSGNQAVTCDNQPVIFDPAVYFGDRETDIAMTELFGGFSTRFYTAYNEEWPLDDGYPVRRDLYNLYHILNHLNLFGSGYLRQAEQMMERLLSELH